MPRGMAISGDEEHFAITEYVVLPVDQLIVEWVVEVDDARVIALDTARTTCRLHLRFLDQERGMGEKLIAPAVVKVQMGIDDIGDRVGLQPRPGQLTDHIIPNLR